jgi:hypothetical protein
VKGADMLSLMEFAAPLTLVVLALILYFLHRKHERNLK